MLDKLNIICYANKACFRNKNKELVTDISPRAILGLYIPNSVFFDFFIQNNSSSQYIKSCYRSPIK